VRYVRDDGKGRVVGPFSAERIRELRAEGRGSQAVCVMIHHVGTGAQRPPWRKRREVEELMASTDASPGRDSPSPSLPEGNTAKSPVEDDPPSWLRDPRDRRQWGGFVALIRSIERLGPWGRAAVNWLVPILMAAWRQREVRRPDRQAPHDVRTCSCQTCRRKKSLHLRRLQQSLHNQRLGL
jgi:hypothetical protein